MSEMANGRANKLPTYTGLIKPLSQMPAINKKIISYSIWVSVLITSLQHAVILRASDTFWYISYKSKKEGMMADAFLLVPSSHSTGAGVRA